MIINMWWLTVYGVQLFLSLAGQILKARESQNDGNSSPDHQRLSMRIRPNSRQKEPVKKGCCN